MVNKFLTTNEEGLRDLLIFVMVNDQPSVYSTKALHDYLDKLSVDMGFTNWIDAYHNL